MRNKHILIEANDCNPGLLSNGKHLLSFLNGFHLVTNSILLATPSLVNRSGTEANPSYSGFIATSDYHISFCTYSGMGKIVLFILSDHDVDLDSEKIIGHLTHHFSIDYSSVKLKSVENNAGGFIECQEPDCVRRAAKQWKGRSVCNDHYDEYRDHRQLNVEYDEHNY